MLTRIGANLAAQILAQALAVADRFVLVGILVRAWGPELYADWTVLLAAAGLLAMGELGLGIYFGNNWQASHARSDAVGFRRLVRIALYCYRAIACALAAGAVVFALAGGPEHALLVNRISEAGTESVFLLLAAAVISAIIRGSISQIYRGRGEFARGTIIVSLPPASYLVTAIVAASLGASPVGLAVLYLLCDLTGTGLMVLDIKRRFPDLELVPAPPNAAELADIAALTKWNAMLMGAPIAWLQVPVLLLGAIGIGGGALVSFVLLRTLASTVRSLTTLASLSAAVEIAPIFHKGETGRLPTLLYAVGAGNAALVGALCAAMLLLAEDFVGLWTGRRELFDAPTFYWLLSASVAATASMPLVALFMLGNRPRPAALASLLQLALGLAGCAVLAPSYGAAGAAAGLAFGEIVASGLVLPILAREHFAIDPWHYLARCCTALLMSSAWCAAILSGAIWLLGSRSPVAFSTCVGVVGLFGLLPAVYASLPQSRRTTIRHSLVDVAKRLLRRAPSS